MQSSAPTLILDSQKVTDKRRLKISVGSQLAFAGNVAETNMSPLKMDGWKMNLLLGPGLFSGAFAVSFRECNSKL